MNYLATQTKGGKSYNLQAQVYEDPCLRNDRIDMRKMIMMNVWDDDANHMGEMNMSM